MATPPKTPPRKAVAKSVMTPAKTPAARATRAAATPPEKPFTIEPESLSAFIDKSDSALPGGKPVAKPAPEPVVAKADAPAVPAAPLKSGAVRAATRQTPAVSPEVKPVVVKPPVATPPAAPVVQTVPPVAAAAAPISPVAAATAPVPPVAAATAPIKASPSQPAVAEDKLAATPKAAAQWQAPNALEGHHIMNEAIETSKKFAEDAKARLQTLVTDFNDKAKVAVEKSSKTAEELSDIAKGNLEALVESSKIAAKGFETLGQSAAEYGRQSFEKTSATLKSFASVKSPTEFFQLHSDLVTSTFDALASETARTSEAVLKLAGEIVQPISNRYAVVSDKLKTIAA